MRNWYDINVVTVASGNKLYGEVRIPGTRGRARDGVCRLFGGHIIVHKQTFIATGSYND